LKIKLLAVVIFSLFLLEGCQIVSSKQDIWKVKKIKILSCFSTTSLDDIQNKCLDKKLVLRGDSLLFDAFDIKSSYQLEKTGAKDFFYGDARYLEYFNVLPDDTLTIYALKGNVLPKKIAIINNKLVFNIDGITYVLSRG